jgi:excisionase family DNA binding protein
MVDISKLTYYTIATMTGIYTTLEKRTVSLSPLTRSEFRFLGELTRRFKENVSFLEFETSYMDPSSPVFAQAERLGREVRETPLFVVCDDLGKRLGIRQGFLVKDEVVELYAGRDPEREFTTGEAARVAGCTHEAVRKAIRSGRLRARRVGRFSLIRETDARAFAAGRGKQGGRTP